MAGLIPKQFIDDLITRIDIVEVIDERVPLKKAGKDYKACCPFHDEKTPSFTVSTDKQFYHCFGCGAHGTAIGFLMEYDHMSFPEAVEELAKRAGLEVPREGRTGPVTNEPQGGADLLELVREASRWFRSQLRDHPTAAEAIEYLKRRGITGEIAKEFEIGLAPDGWDNLLRALGKDAATREALVTAGLAVKKEGGGAYDRFRARVMFPIHDHRGRIVGFGGRVMDKGEPKYLNSPETPLFHKGRELYGLYRARDAIKRENRVLVVEGYMDVVALAQFGINNAVATLGTATTREHLERLYRHAPEVVFCFDGDRAGREAAWRALDNALPVLHEGRQASFLFLPEGEDPDTLVRKEGAEAFVARIRNGLSLPDFLFQGLASDVDLGRIDGRARLVELARPYLSKMPQSLLRQLMVEKLGEISRVNSEKLSTLLLTDPADRPARHIPERQAAEKHKPPTLMRLLVALLVQNPRLVAHVDAKQELFELDLPGMRLFLEIVTLLKDRPGLNTAALVEHFRDTEDLKTVTGLATWDHERLRQDVEAEFRGTLERLPREALTWRIDQLLQRQRAGIALTGEEQAELKGLLAQKTAGTGPISSSH
jgi:DNA primase